VPPVTAMLPKLRATLDPLTRMPSEVEPDTVVLPKLTAPETDDVREIPWAVLEVVATLAKPEVALKFPLSRFSACPGPLKDTSGATLSPTVKLTNPLPLIFVPVVLPTVNPRSVLP